MKAVSAVLLVLSFGVVVYGAINADLITNLPGWTDAFPSRQFSGYLDIPGGKHLHYWFVESEQAPSKDPVVIWFNGGPGCSSLDGFLYEHGPMHIQEPIQNGTIPKLYINPWRWNMIANLLFIDAPACVGLSYADTNAGCRNNDTQQAIDNLRALQRWYAGFPEYAGNSLFISGESYAGVYVPTLALQILRNAPSIPLKGILVGNGVIGDAGQDSTRIAVEYLHGHGLYSDAVYANIIKNCPDMFNPSPACYAYLGQMEDQVGHVNIYNIYGPCINHGFPPESNKATSATRYWKRPLSKGEQVVFGGKGQVGGPDACIDAGAASYYLNLDVVRQALHAKPVSQIGPWQICTDRLIYDVIQPSLLPDYKNTLIPNIRVLIYNGEADACVPYNGNEEWTSGLGVPVQEDWRAWLVDQQVAGYVTTYQSNFKFATIKGAGHMVPQTQPQWAFYMFSRFINNQPL